MKRKLIALGLVLVALAAAYGIAEWRGIDTRAVVGDWLARVQASAVLRSALTTFNDNAMTLQVVAFEWDIVRDSEGAQRGTYLIVAVKVTPQRAREQGLELEDFTAHLMGEMIQLLATVRGRAGSIHLEIVEQIAIEPRSGYPLYEITDMFHFDHDMLTRFLTAAADGCDSRTFSVFLNDHIDNSYRMMRYFFDMRMYVEGEHIVWLDEGEAGVGGG